MKFAKRKKKSRHWDFVDRINEAKFATVPDPLATVDCPRCDQQGAEMSKDESAAAQTRDAERPAVGNVMPPVQVSVLPADPRVKFSAGDISSLITMLAEQFHPLRTDLRDVLKGIAGQALAALDLAREVALERSVRLQLANDSQTHLDRALKAEADLALNKSMLAKQCDLARQAEADLAATKTSWEKTLLSLANEEDENAKLRDELAAWKRPCKDAEAQVFKYDETGVPVAPASYTLRLAAQNRNLREQLATIKTSWDKTLLSLANEEDENAKLRDELAAWKRPAGNIDNYLRAGPSIDDIVKHYRVLAAQVRDLREQLAENICDACGGTGKPTSGGPCMCGGSGKMSDAARYLREQLAVVTEELEQYKTDNGIFGVGA